MKPLTDMTAEELLEEFSVLIHKLTVTPDAPEMAARRFALHGELLRRLAAPVISPEPKCPKCGSARLDVLRAAIIKCSECLDETLVSEMANFAQFFTSKAEGWVSVKAVNELAELVLRLQAQQQKWLTPGGRNAMKPAFALAETLLPAPPKEG